jgi:hypothetical protein
LKSFKWKKGLCKGRGKGFLSLSWPNFILLAWITYQEGINLPSYRKILLPPPTPRRQRTGKAKSYLTSDSLHQFLPRRGRFEQNGIDGIERAAIESK